MPERTTLYYLHAFGSSPRAFGAVAAHLPDDHRVVGVDLPGFGHLADDPDFETGPTVERIVEQIARTQDGRWVLVGHSRGGRLATLVAARALRGDARVFGLAGIVLLSASPPSPEPMEDSTRERMLSWGANGRISGDEAREFLRDNVAHALAPELDALAMRDLERTSVAAWRAWLEHGSDEDWSSDVGVLDVPAVILAGRDDDMLGPDAQYELSSPVYPRADYLVLDDARHLLPLEKPAEVAAAIERFVRERVERAPVVPTAYARMLSGDHVSDRTRGILARRALPDAADYEPQALDAGQLATLRALADLVVPQDTPTPTPGEPSEMSPTRRGDLTSATAHIDVAARVDAQLAAGRGDGWRDASLPPDVVAYRTALTALEGRVDAETVQSLVDGEADLPGPFDAAQLSAWFADCRVDLARQWLAHPATMARIGSDAIATGQDEGLHIQGFRRIGAAERESWEAVR